MSALKPRTTTVVIFDGDDFEEIDRLRGEVESAALKAAADGEVRRVGDAPAVQEAAERYDAFIEEATQRGTTVRLFALKRREFGDLKDKHPAREKNEDDAAWGFNYETLADDLVPACVDPQQFPSIADRDEFLENLSDGDWSRVYSAAVKLNAGVGPDPKARISSSLGRTSDETSESPARLG